MIEQHQKPHQDDTPGHARRRAEERTLESLPSARGRPWLWPALAALVALLTVLAGCSGSSTSDGSTTGGVSSTVEPTTGNTAPAGLDRIMRLATNTSETAGTINTFWSQNFPTWWPNKQYQPPTRFVPYHNGQVPDTACGRDDPVPDHWVDNAVYCLPDHTVAYELEFMQRSYKQYPSAPLAFIAHEWTHLVQQLSGFKGEFTVEEELYADCGSGLYFAYANQLGLLNIADMNSAARGFYENGNTDSPWFLPDEHGTPQQRSTAFLTGFKGTIKDCYQIGSNPPQGDVVLPGLLI
jgi:uncharacterized protein